MVVQLSIKRTFDLFLALILVIFLAIPLCILIIILKLSSRESIVYWSKRVGIGNKIFMMPKFRTMREDTPQLASHLMRNPEDYLTPFGGFLRRSSLDEVPQLWSILQGDMSFVGPRPALFNQDDLISLRTQKGIDGLMPGLTGWAQVNGRDELSIPIKVEYEVEYLNKKSFWFDMKILGLTFLKVVRRSDVSH